MIIECPACHTRSKFPDSKDGAKVRCGECSRVFVARARGSKRASSSPSSGVVIGGGALFVAIVLAVILMQTDPPEKRAAAPPEEAAAGAGPSTEMATNGWEAPPVQWAARLHDLAHARNAAGLQGLLDGAELWKRELARAEEAGEEAPGPEDWPALEGTQRIRQLELWALELTEGDESVWIRDWRPYDGDVLRDDIDDVTVELYATPWEGGVEKRTVRWFLIPDKSTWRVGGWERELSKDEFRAQLAAKRGYERKVLTSGRKVTEREPEPLEHLADTPPELRARIDELFTTMIDLDAALAGTRASAELIEIGKPAIPRLLTGLFELGLDFTDTDSELRGNLIASTLREITGEYFGYDPRIDPEDALGTTMEIRDSSIKQWFAWWYRKGARFERRPEPEPETLDQGF